MKGVNEAFEHLGIFRGGIVTPKDFAEMVEDAGKPVAGLEGWAFSVPMSKNADRAIRRSPKVALSVGVFGTPLGLSLVVATLQAASVQIRVVADLADPRIQHLLRWSADRGAMTFLCAARGAKRVRLMVHSVEREDIATILEQTPRRCTVPFLHHAVEIASAAWVLKELDYIESCDRARRVKEVSVCTIVPDAARIAEMAGVAGPAEMEAMAEAVHGTAPTVH
jgi:hypothetical protein